MDVQSLGCPGLPLTYGKDPLYNPLIAKKDAKELAIYYTVEYFKNKQVAQEIFMRHLETVYNFLLEGTVSYK